MSRPRPDDPLDRVAYALALAYWRGYLTASLGREPKPSVLRRRVRESAPWFRAEARELVDDCRTTSDSPLLHLLPAMIMGPAERNLERHFVDLEDHVHGRLWNSIHRRAAVPVLRQLEAMENSLHYLKREMASFGRR